MQYYLLNSYIYWGSQFLQKIKGMFSFAVWDNKLNQLTLVRDRIGEKPLYYGWVNDSFVFSSELDISRE